MASEVMESGRAVIRCKYLGPTNRRTSRVKVNRFDPPSLGRDPNTIIVAWDYALNPIQNFQFAVAKYVERAGWMGSWLVSSVPDGAVAVCVPDTHVVSLSDKCEAYQIIDECEMLHLLTGSVK